MADLQSGKSTTFRNWSRVHLGYHARKLALEGSQLSPAATVTMRHVGCDDLVLVCIRLYNKFKYWHFLLRLDEYRYEHAFWQEEIPVYFTSRTWHQTSALIVSSQSLNQIAISNQLRITSATKGVRGGSSWIIQSVQSESNSKPRPCNAV